jgi:hypothetical protein
MSKAPRDVWLSRELSPLGCYYCLCFTEKEYDRRIKWLGIRRHSENKFPDNGAILRVNFHKAKDSKPVAIVCLNPKIMEGYSGIVIAGFLIHEAVHIWQTHSEYIGSNEDHGGEEEAYAIQNIAHNLMQEYSRRINEKAKKKAKKGRTRL